MFDEILKRYIYCCYDHRTFTTTAVVGYHRTNTTIAVFYSVLGGLSGLCFLTSAAQSRDSHLNAASFDYVNARRVSPVSHTTCLALRVSFPTHCWSSRDSLGIILSQTITTVSLSVPSTVVCPAVSN